MRKLNFLRRPQPRGSVDTQVFAAIDHLAIVLGIQSIEPWETEAMRNHARLAIKELRAVVAALA